MSTYNKPLSDYLKAVSQLTGKEVVLDSTAATTSNLGQVWLCCLACDYLVDADVELVIAILIPLRVHIHTSNMACCSPWGSLLHMHL